MTPSEIELATFRLVAQCLNQLLRRVPQLVQSVIIIFLIKASSKLTIRIRIRTAVLILLASCQQTCTTYTIAVYTVKNC